MAATYHPNASTTPVGPSATNKTLSTIISQVEIIASYYKAIGVDITKNVQISTCRRNIKFGCNFQIRGPTLSQCHSVTRTGDSRLAALNSCTSKIVSLLAQQHPRFISQLEANLKTAIERGQYSESQAVAHIVKLQELSSCVAPQDWFATAKDEDDSIEDIWIGMTKLSLVDVGVNMEVDSAEDELVAIWNAAMSL